MSEPTGKADRRDELLVAAALSIAMHLVFTGRAYALAIMDKNAEAADAASRLIVERIIEHASQGLSVTQAQFAELVSEVAGVAERYAAERLLRAPDAQSPDETKSKTEPSSSN
jgi:hypothetical protein